jgi:hypothetical protein
LEHYKALKFAQHGFLPGSTPEARMLEIGQTTLLSIPHQHFNWS